MPKLLDLKASWAGSDTVETSWVVALMHGNPARPRFGRLPVELLTNIFKDACRAMPISSNFLPAHNDVRALTITPLLLASVCSFWRSIAPLYSRNVDMCLRPGKSGRRQRGIMPCHQPPSGSFLQPSIIHLHFRVICKSIHTQSPSKDSVKATKSLTSSLLEA